MRPRFGQVAMTFLAILVLSAVSLVASAQEDPSPTVSARSYTAAQHDQLLAPIALYPDPLLGQVLMASTYPLEVVEAARWVADPAHAGLTGDALVSALEPIEWDPSVKALVPFPSVLQMMDSHLDWMQKLGDAFLAQQADVMDAVQRLRRQAQSAGALASTPQQRVTTEDGVIGIEPASPDILYVPAYDPSVLYSPWPYPDYPPYFFPPPPYYYYPPVLTGIEYGVGFVIVPTYWGWHHPDWHRHRIDVDPRRVNVINRHAFDHSRRPPFEERTWVHDPQHRIGVPYRSPQVRQRFERKLPGTSQERYEFRGHLRPPSTVRIPPAQLPPAGRIVPRVTEPPAPRIGGRPAAPIYQQSRSGAEARASSNRGRDSRQSTPAVRTPPASGRGGGYRSGGSPPR